jgi:pimeloyl-ACP methyl ester carboxylesterase
VLQRDGECYETASRIEDEKECSYTEAWQVTAERVEEIARKSLAGGHLVSAREAFLRASSYWREVGFYQSTTDPKCRLTWERQRECFTQAGKLMDVPFEVVSIPYENGKSPPGYFLKAEATEKPRPTLLSLGGGDSLAEELYFWRGGAAALRRGYNALLFEIPGQRGAMYSNPDAELFYRPDTEGPLKYVCDWALGRADVDSKRLALVGWSMGGNFAPRAAAFEKRIKACIASTTSPNLQTSILEMPGGGLQRLAVVERDRIQQHVRHDRMRGSNKRLTAAGALLEMQPDDGRARLLLKRLRNLPWRSRKTRFRQSWPHSCRSAENRAGRNPLLAWIPKW